MVIGTARMCIRMDSCASVNVPSRRMAHHGELVEHLRVEEQRAVERGRAEPDNRRQKRKKHDSAVRPTRGGPLRQRRKKAAAPPPSTKK